MLKITCSCEQRRLGVEFKHGSNIMLEVEFKPNSIL